MKKKVTGLFEYMCSSCGMDMCMDMCMGMCMTMCTTTAMSGSCCDLIALSPWNVMTPKDIK